MGDEEVAAFLGLEPRYDFADLAKNPDHYEKDEKFKTVNLTELGSETVEQMLEDAELLTEGNLYDVFNVSLVHHVNQSLRAHTLFTRDVDYIVKNEQVIIIDEFTGRMMEGRRYSDGLHQALEAKEHVPVERENQTLASITFQNYFRLYPKLSGMTGTAMTEADEFEEIYKLQSIEIPTNVAIARDDQDDEVYRSADEKYQSVAKLIEECRARQQPVLVGTVSIEKSEVLSGLLHQLGIPHNVLNARFHDQEAVIVADAGAPGAVTIATNMAGRGTDIKLGGNLDMRLETALEGLEGDERAAREAQIRTEIEAAEQVVKQAGGLFVIGTERHESRRIDNQLRGRSGRQGDPGASRFFLSLDDDLMRIFGSERMGPMLERLGLGEGEAIVHPWINKALEKAQKKVEARNFDTRKNLLKYDDVMNDQRKEVYAQRREFMRAEDVSQVITEMRADVIANLVEHRIPEKAYAEQWESTELAEDVERVFGLSLPVVDWAAEEGIDESHLRERIEEAVEAHMAAKAANIGPELMRIVEKSVLLQTLDHLWKEHLLALDHLRQGIGLRAYGQRDPLNEYKSEAFALFTALLDELKEQVTLALSHVELAPEQAPEQPVFDESGLITSHPSADIFQGAEDGDLALAAPPGETMQFAPSPYRAESVDPERPETWAATPRNAPCPCGSGKKFKHCHGRVT